MHREFVNSCGAHDIILKPLDGMGGAGIFFALVRTV